MVYRCRKSRYQISVTAVVGIWIFLIISSIFTYIIMTSDNYMSMWMMTVMMNLKYASQLALAVLMFYYRFIMLPITLLRPVRFVAMISYSLYIVHIPILDWMKSFQNPQIMKFASYLFISVLISTFSFHLIEKPTMNYFRRWDAHKQQS